MSGFKNSQPEKVVAANRYVARGSHLKVLLRVVLDPVVEGRARMPGVVYLSLKPGAEARPEVLCEL